MKSPNTATFLKSVSRYARDAPETSNRLLFAWVPWEWEELGPEQGMGRWVMGQMGHENRMGHMGHGSLGVDP